MKYCDCRYVQFDGHTIRGGNVAERIEITDTYHPNENPASFIVEQREFKRSGDLMISENGNQLDARDIGLLYVLLVCVVGLIAVTFGGDYVTIQTIRKFYQERGISKNLSLLLTTLNHLSLYVRKTRKRLWQDLLEFLGYQWNTCSHLKGTWEGLILR